MLDLLLEHFGDGVRWTRGRYYDGRGRHCLIGAIHYLHLRLKHRIPSEPALHFLREAMPRRTFGLVYFNDYRCRGFDELRAVILKARALALGEAEWGGPLRQSSAGCLGRWGRNATRAWPTATFDRGLRFVQWRPKRFLSHTSRNHGVGKWLNPDLAR
jgi:hypothetical protein